jgi:hypothetical protein
VRSYFRRRACPKSSFRGARLPSREPGIQAFAVQVGEAVWIPGSPLRGAPE